MEFRKDAFNVFLSEPFTGLSPAELEANHMNDICNLFAKVYTKDSKKPINVITMYDIDTSKDVSIVQSLGKDIEMIGRCDMVVFGRGSMGSKGCTIERYVVEEYDIPYIDLTTGCASPILIHGKHPIQVDVQCRVVDKVERIEESKILCTCSQVIAGPESVVHMHTTVTTFLQNLVPLHRFAHTFHATLTSQEE